MVFGIVALAFGKDRNNFANEDVEAVAFASADRDDLGEIELAGQRVDEGQKAIFLHQVDLCEDEEDGALELADETEEKFVFAGPVGGFMFGRRRVFNRTLRECSQSLT